jgi:hypothetical protein
VEITVVMEEGVVLRRGSLVLCPFGGEEYCCVDDSLVPIYTNSLAPTSWEDSQLQDQEKIQRERGFKEISLIFNSFISRDNVKQ